MRVLAYTRTNSICFDKGIGVVYHLDGAFPFYMGNIPYVMYGWEHSSLFGGTDSEENQFGGLICVF